MNDNRTINGWMADEHLVLPRSVVGFYIRGEMWLGLKMLPGLDVPEFLEGAKMAYDTVTRGMYARDWDGLRPLVSKRMFEAMKGAMEQYGDDAKRIEGFEADDAIEVTAARLARVRLFNDMDSPWAPRRCHIDVHFSTLESWKIWDYRDNAHVEPFDGQRRVQEYTWRFEGSVMPPRMTEEEALAKDLSTYDLLSVTAPGAPVNADEIETLPDQGDPWIVESIV